MAGRLRIVLLVNPVLPDLRNFVEYVLVFFSFVSNILNLNHVEQCKRLSENSFLCRPIQITKTSNSYNLKSVLTLYWKIAISKLMLVFALYGKYLAKSDWIFYKIEGLSIFKTGNPLKREICSEAMNFNGSF